MSTALVGTLGGASFTFDGKNKLAQAAVDEFFRDYKWRIAQSERAAVASIVERSIREGIEPRKAARMVESVVGLDEKSAGALWNYSDSIFDADVAPAIIDKRIERYKKKLLRARAKRIARTETMGAMNAGQLESFRQARDAGLLESGAGKEWIVALDDDLCEICAPMDKEVVPVDDDFSNGLPYPPAHPNCRCTVGPASPEEVAESLLRVPAAPPVAPGNTTPTVLETSDFDDDGFPSDDYVREGYPGSGASIDRTLSETAMYTENVISDEAKSALYDYIAYDEYIAMNQTLRSKAKAYARMFANNYADDFAEGTMLRKLKVIQEAIEDAPRIDTIAYRKTHLPQKTISRIVNQEIGSTFRLGGFHSTSMSVETATSFGGDYLLEIRVRQGLHLVQSAEQEILLPHGSKFRLRGIKRVKVHESIGRSGTAKMVERTVVQLEQIVD